jgi:hypothetical protein
MTYDLYNILSDDRMSLPFTIAAGPRQSSHSLKSGTGSLGTHDHILLSQIRDSPHRESQAPYSYPSRTEWPSYTHRHWVPFSSSPTTRRTTVEVFELASTKSESYVTTDGQSASLSWNKASIWGLRPESVSLSDSCGFVDVGRSEKRTSLSFTIASGPRQRSYFRVPWILLSQIRDFSFCSLLRLAGSRWRYSTPPLLDWCTRYIISARTE